MGAIAAMEVKFINVDGRFRKDLVSYLLEHFRRFLTREAGSRDYTTLSFSQDVGDDLVMFNVFNFEGYSLVRISRVT